MSVSLSVCRVGPALMCSSPQSCRSPTLTKVSQPNPSEFISLIPRIVHLPIAVQKVRAAAPDRSETFFSLASNDYHGAGQVTDEALELEAAAATATKADDTEKVNEKN